MISIAQIQKLRFKVTLLNKITYLVNIQINI